MSAQETHRLLSALTGDAHQEAPSLERLCRRTADLLPVNGASITLMGQGASQSATGAFGGVAQALQDLEFTLGEGPGTDAYTHGRPEFIDEMRSVNSRWPLFTQAALAVGARSIYALPLQLGAIKLGVLALCSNTPGGMSVDDLTEAVIVASLLTKLVLNVQSDTAREVLAWALDISDGRAVVHQATGMVAAQLNCGVAEALARLRGNAFAASRPIDEIASEVVEGDLRFDTI
jgi:hypothetical protein